MREINYQEFSVVEWRILSFLAKEIAVTEETARSGHVLLSSEGGTISSPKTVLELFSCCNMIEIRDQAVHLTDLGRAILKNYKPVARQSSAGRSCSSTNIEHDGEWYPVQINLAESPLAQLYRRKTSAGSGFLSNDEFMAGERLRADFTRGCLMPRITSNWEQNVSKHARGSAGGGAELSDAALSARLRVDKALEAVGPELNGVLVDICCFLKGLELVERERQWPVRSAKMLLKTALAILHRHYHPVSHARATAHKNQFHWGADDYRPSL